MLKQTLDLIIGQWTRQLPHPPGLAPPVRPPPQTVTAGRLVLTPRGSSQEVLPHPRGPPPQSPITIPPPPPRVEPPYTNEEEVIEVPRIIETGTWPALESMARALAPYDRVIPMYVLDTHGE